MIKTDDTSLCKKSTEFKCRELDDIKLERISKSSRDTFTACRRAFYYKRVCGIRVKPEHKSDALKLGSIWDEFIEYAYRGESFRDRYDELADEYELSELNHARIRPMFKAYRSLGIQNSTGGTHQKRFEFKSGPCVINGIIDVAHHDHFEEHKFSGSPQYYQSPYNMAQQLSTYFLSNPDYKYATMMIAKKPGLRLKKGEYLDDFESRVYSDIISRPSEYFIGLDRATMQYGVRFFRDEFEPLKAVIEDYEMVNADMMDAFKTERWYQNRNNCHKFGPDNACQYLSICDIGRINEELFDIKEKYYEIRA